MNKTIIETEENVAVACREKLTANPFFLKALKEEGYLHFSVHLDELGEHEISGWLHPYSTPDGHGVLFETALIDRWRGLLHTQVTVSKDEGNMTWY